MIRQPPRSPLFPLHDALPISRLLPSARRRGGGRSAGRASRRAAAGTRGDARPRTAPGGTPGRRSPAVRLPRSEEHTSELQSHVNLVCRLLLEKKKKNKNTETT